MKSRMSLFVLPMFDSATRPKRLMFNGGDHRAAGEDSPSEPARSAAPCASHCFAALLRFQLAQSLSDLILGRNSARIEPSAWRRKWRYRLRQPKQVAVFVQNCGCWVASVSVCGWKGALIYDFVFNG
jgi:hypothetical protein